ncbi:hypothetical protein FOA52_005788 [Chlamydomonas sp. UWO 241]|nr:hypothetical protein FOA52_005788 [Chlamydomonas sp. UWO 241]
MRALASHRGGPINTHSLRLQPLQHALLALVAANPSLLLELIVSMQTSWPEAGPIVSVQTIIQPHATRRPSGQYTRDLGGGSVSGGVVPAGSVVAEAGEKLAGENAMLEGQLAEVSAECERLQALVDEAERSGGAGASALRFKLQEIEAEHTNTLEMMEAGEAQMMDMQHQIKVLTLELQLASEDAAQRTRVQRHSSLSAMSPHPGTPAALRGRRGSVNRSSSWMQAPAGPSAGGGVFVSARGGGVRAARSEPRIIAAVPENSVSAYAASSHGSMIYPASSRTMEELLECLELDHLLPRFESEEISLEMLPYLDEQQLRDLGVTTVGARMRLRAALARRATLETGNSRASSRSGCSEQHHQPREWVHRNDA